MKIDLTRLRTESWSNEMRLEPITIYTELEIFYGLDTMDKKMSYIQEIVCNSKHFNKKIPELMFNIATSDPEWTPYVIGFLMALKIVKEQEDANQENELERIFNLK